MATDTHERERLGNKTCLVYGGLLIVVSVTALCLAYFGVGDPAWARRARLASSDGQPYGFFIELFRPLLLIPLAMIALGYGFSRQVDELLAVHQRTTWNAFSTAARLGVVMTTITLGCYFVGNCFDRTSDGMLATSIAFGHEQHVYAAALDEGEMASLHRQVVSARSAYWYYAIYAAVIYGGILPLIICVPIYAFATEDFAQIRREQSVLEAAVAGREGEEDPTHAQHAVQVFREYYRRLTGVASRYISLLAAVGGGVAFEQYFGSLAMSPEAQTNNSTLALGVAIAAGLCVAAALYCYFDGWQAIQRYLDDSDQQSLLPESQYTPQAFVRILLKHNKMSYIMLSLLASPWFAHPIRGYLEKFLQLLG